MKPRKAAITISDVRLVYEGPVPVCALESINLDIYENEFFTLLGPSGCGKTTLLRLIAGFEQPTEGHLMLDGTDLVGKPPFERPVNTVFQSYALFPHLTVSQNVAFALQMQRRPKHEIRKAVDETLKLVKLADLAGRKPAHLSGGQQQRVALARALVSKPRVLLLDESLSALDLKLRKEMQLELKRLQRETGITFVFVTHDQEEALTMSDRIAVMSNGRIQQLDTPSGLYDRPVNRFVAAFIGEMNLLSAEADGNLLRFAPASKMSNPSRTTSGKVCVAARPERLSLLSLQDEASHMGVDALPGIIDDIIYLGADTLVLVRLPDQSPCKVRLQNRGADLAFKRGDEVAVLFPTDALRVYPD